MPEYIKGIVNLRGDIIPVIDLAIIFDFQNTHYLDSTSLGTIAAAGLKYLKSCNRKLVFINVSKELEKNFVNLGFGPIADMEKDVEIEKGYSQ